MVHMKKRKSSFAIVILLFISLIFFLPYAQCEETDDNEIKTEFSSIQEAIDTTFEGDTVYIYGGEYYEDILINKSVNLEGKSLNGYDPVIIGNVTIAANNVTLSNLYIRNGSGIRIAGYVNILAGDAAVYKNITIKNNVIENNSGYGIYSKWTYNINIINNVIKNNNGGIFIQYVNDSIIQENTIINNFEDGIYLGYSRENSINKNNIEDNDYGLHCNFWAHKNIIHENTFNKNQNYGIYINDSESINNEIYHNSFINNTKNVYDGGINFWNASHLKEGNYWDDYTGIDENLQNGIGDTPYTIPGSEQQDKYPLMSPYDGRIILDKYIVDRGSVQTMLIVGIIVAIIFCLPIGLWWRKKYFK